MQGKSFPYSGLSEDAVIASRGKFGSNEIRSGDGNSLWKRLRGVVLEPMFIILMVAAVLYFALGEIPEASFMLGAILMVSAISFFQESRSDKALAALKTLTAPKAKVIRNGQVGEIPYQEIVVGDYMIAEEGTIIAADGRIVQSNDFAVNESILTGESFTVTKDRQADPGVYKGTLAVSGLAVCEVTAVGRDTRLGKIGESLKEIKEEQTPLQKQIEHFVKQMAIIGGIVFVLIWILNFAASHQVLDSLLKALTLAMSILPEEIPVAFTTFMALGAWRLMQKGVIVKETRTVETLGPATVICTDKTGTITENRMELAKVYFPGGNAAVMPGEWQQYPDALALVRYSMWASEPVPFDPMEKALHEAYQDLWTNDERPEFSMIHEYPLSGKPPMMTHIFENARGERIIAAKGAPEAILKLVSLHGGEREKTFGILEGMLKEGYRVLAVAASNFSGNEFPEQQDELPFVFLGLVAFYDPPKWNIRDVFNGFYQAGIKIKIITGDNSLTTMTIAQQAGLKMSGSALEGEALLKMDEEELRNQVERTHIFTRMFPDAKLRIIQALKKNGEIVAMTGDGVNDGPALKAAHIGIAMGKRGSEVARQASSLILMDDDLGKMLDAVAMGRKIYANLKKAIQYIISIHIPIILTVSLPLLLGWQYPNLFTPVHVIFLELIMGPTCSIAYENEPAEVNIMQQGPRPLTRTFLSWKELSVSIWQGLVISVATLFVYQYGLLRQYDEMLIRTTVFICLVTANIFLTLVNRSFYFSMLTTFRYRNWLIRGIIVASVGLLLMLIKVPLLRNFFQFSEPSLNQLTVPLVAGIISVIWFEIYKWVLRQRQAGLAPNSAASFNYGG